MLGDHDVGIRARAADHVALAEAGHDARALAAARSRAAPGSSGRLWPEPRAAHEIGQAAGAAHLPAAQHLRVGLTGQIDRQHRVDRDEVVDLADHPHVVRVADRREPERRAAARPVVDPRTAERGGAHHGARVVRLARAGEHTRLVQIGHLVADQPAVQAEIAPVAQAREHGGRHLADADLDRVAVVDQAGDVRADPMGLRRQAARRERDQRAIRLDHVVEPVVRDLIAVRRAAAWPR